ncbi:MAG: hypothetical protein WDM76_16560 [Limisphaerales bacterium]
MKLTAGNTSVGWHSPGLMNQLLASLAALTTNDTRAVVTNGPQIIRIISPHTAFDANWPSMLPYVDYVQSNGISTHIAGTYNGRDPFTPDPLKQQTYDFSATIDAATNLVLTGSCGVVGPTTIIITNSDLLEAIYSFEPCTKSKDCLW